MPLQWSAYLTIGSFATDLCGMKGHRLAHSYENAQKQQGAIG
jgi:hypothetical protein